MVEKEQFIDIEKELNKGTIVQLKPRGYSMYPLLIPGRDEARIAPLGSHRIKKGDVLLYRRESGMLVLHRVARRIGNELYMVGDNQSKKEGPLRLEQMRGIMIGFVRSGSYHSVHNPVYALYASLWLFLRPLRPVISRTVSRLKHRLRG